MQIIPVILSGGAGTRLWPLSRLSYPKQFLNLSPDGATLLQATAQRIKDAALFAPPVVICNSEHRFIIAEQLRQIGIDTPSILLEPMGRNTAPALTVAALHIQKLYGKDAVMLAIPSDHIMKDVPAFLEAVKAGLPQAQKGQLVTFGITPSHAETAYGYIARGNALDEQHGIYAIHHFAEKPDAARAKEYIDSGKYAWNSGMFLFCIKTYLAELEKHAPDMASLCAKSLADSKKDLDFIRLDEAAFAKLPSVAVDTVVMEKTQKGAVIRLDCGWSDLGAWDALWDVNAKDANGNVVVGKAHLIDSTNSYVRSDGQLIGMVGVDNLIVISTKDAVLVASKDKAQDIKALVDVIRKTDKPLVENHRRVYRPWGYYESVDEGGRHQVKHLCVKPKEKLSLQMHHHRAEHWIVVQGTAKIILDDKEFTLSENQSFYIPIGAKHSLENPGKINLDIIEVQSGSYLGEDDIVRFEDKYNRNK